MDSVDRENCAKMLLAFSVEESNKGKPVPDQVTDYLLGDYVGHVADSPQQASQSEQVLDDFVVRFEEYITDQAHKFPRKKVPGEDISSAKRAEVEKYVTRLYEAQEEKRRSTEDLLTHVKQLVELRRLVQNKFEASAEVEPMEVECLEGRLNMLKDKVTSRLLKETPHTMKAVQKLNALLEDEKKEVNSRLAFLEDREAKYRAVETDPEYKKILTQYKKLLQRKEALLLARQD